MNTGELGLMKRLGNQLEITQIGKGFTWEDEVSMEEHKKAAAIGLNMAEEALLCDDYKLVVLDEILYALGAGLVTEDMIVNLIDKKPEETHLVLTGRGATERLIEKADLVTNMTLVKHPSQAGIPAQKFLDY
jgi:cob(I)alamin adenosyltransferase